MLYLLGCLVKTSTDRFLKYFYWENISIINLLYAGFAQHLLIVCDQILERLVVQMLNLVMLNKLRQLIVSQSDYLSQIVHIDSYTE